MASQASKRAAMANGAARSILNRIFPGVPVEKIAGMVRRLKLGVRRVTRLAAEWRVNFVMAHQTVRHVRECRVRYH